MKQAALEYATNGYKVFPCKFRDRAPHIKRNLKEATTDEATIMGWWDKWPNAVIGLPMRANALVALDLDRHEGKPDGIKTWKELSTELEIPAKTAVMAKTGGPQPGYHLIWHHPGNGHKLKIPMGTGIDLRDDAYLVVPPSSQPPPGGAYSWIDGCSLLEVDPDPLPKALLQYMLNGRNGRDSDLQVNFSSLGGSCHDAVVKLLIRHGWCVAEVVDDNVRLRRPGKQGGCSAAWNGVSLRMFTSNAPPFEPEADYSALQVEDMLEGPDSGWYDGEVERLVGEIQLTLDVKSRTRLIEQLAKLLTRAGAMRHGEVAARLHSTGLCNKTDFRSQIVYEKKKQKKSPGAQSSKSRGVTTKEFVQLFQTFNFNLRLNECNDDVELNGQYLGDVALAKITTTLSDWDIEHPDRRVNHRHLEAAMNTVASENGYHPVKEYLESLEWDNEDHIAKLMSFVKGEYLEKWFRHWMVTSIAKVYEQVQSPMLVLVGAQEIGKSTFVEWLCPIPSMYHQAPLQPNNKDCRMRLWTAWIWEPAELGATTKRTVQEALKWVLTLKTLRERKSYGHRDTIRPVTASFIGTVNADAGFLTDRTGNRRYLISELSDIDWAYSKEMDVDQLWAQAMHMYRNDGGWELSKDDKDLRDKVNLRYMGPSVIGALLSTYYYFDENPKTVDFVFMADVLEELDIAGYRNAYQDWALRQVRSVFRSWGSTAFDKTSGKKRGQAFSGIVRTGHKPRKPIIVEIGSDTHEN